MNVAALIAAEIARRDAVEPEQSAETKALIRELMRLRFNA